MANPYYNNTRSFTPGTAADGNAVDDKFDAVGAGANSIDAAVRRAIKLPVAVTIDQAITQDAAGRADKTLGFDGSGNLTVYANASGNVTAAAASESAASTSASGAAASAGNASTSETNAAASAASASTSASGATTSETNAATSASNAATSATNASTSASNASTSAGNASTSATNAATSASNASTSAGNASTSATNAATSAGNASTSSSNASTSATSAAADAAIATNRYSYQGNFAGSTTYAKNDAVTSLVTGSGVYGFVSLQANNLGNIPPANGVADSWWGIYVGGGKDGVTIDHTSRTSGTGAAGTTDIYTIWADAGSSVPLGTFNVYNGLNGAGFGDMTAATYDPLGIGSDIFAYAQAQAAAMAIALG